jgi:hypothetical protein
MALFERASDFHHGIIYGTYTVLYDDSDGVFFFLFSFFFFLLSSFFFLPFLFLFLFEQDRFPFLVLFLCVFWFFPLIGGCVVIR